MGNLEPQYAPLDRDGVFWRPQPAADPRPAGSETRFTPLDPRGVFWRYDNPNQVPADLALATKRYMDAPSETLPPSAELVAHEQQERAAAYDAMVDEAYAMNNAYDDAAQTTMLHEAYAMNEVFDRQQWSRGRHRLGAMGILAYAHPDITTPAQAVHQREAFEQRTTSAANYLTHFAGEALTARWHRATRAVGRFAARLTSHHHAQQQPQSTQESSSRFSAADLAFLAESRLQRLATDHQYRGMRPVSAI
jgi:hypothetical protein